MEPYRVQLTPEFIQQLSRIDPEEREAILKFVYEDIVENPWLGTPLDPGFLHLNVLNNWRRRTVRRMELWIKKKLARS